MSRGPLALAAVLVLAAACAETAVATVRGDHDAGPAVPQEKGDAAGTVVGTGEAGTVAQCSTGTVAGDRVCVPGRGRANTAILVDAISKNACVGRTYAMEPCTGVLDGGHVRLTLAMRSCTDPATGADTCSAFSFDCTIPPLDAGTYTIDLEGEAPRVGLPPRQLVVELDAGETSCALEATPSPLDAGAYSAACATDEDCRPAIVGPSCRPCACPDVAIAASSAERYEADYRARTSACPAPSGGTFCAGCAPVKAVCDTSTPGGRCTLVAGP